MNIGIDFDDVLLDCNASLAAFHNRRYGTSYDRHQVRSWQLEILWQCTKEEAVARIQEWYVSSYHDNASPVPGAIEAVSELGREHTLYVITSRSLDKRVLTERWIDRHFANRFAGIHFTSQSICGTGSKVDACGHLGVQLMIEDAPWHSHQVAAAGVPVLLYDTPWNQDMRMPLGITRIYSWNDVLRHVKTQTTLVGT